MNKNYFVSLKLTAKLGNDTYNTHTSYIHVQYHMLGQTHYKSPRRQVHQEGPHGICMRQLLSCCVCGLHRNMCTIVSIVIYTFYDMYARVTYSSLHLQNLHHSPVHLHFSVI